MKQMISLALTLGIAGQSLWAGDVRNFPVPNADQSAEIQQAIKLSKADPAPKKKSPFWKTKSKGKLFWGLALMAAGSAMTAYGLTPETKTTQKLESRTVEAPVQDPNGVALSNRQTAHLSYDSRGNIQEARLESAVRNNTGLQLTRVRITAVNASGNCEVTDVSPGATKDFSILLTRPTAPTFGYKVESAFALQTQTGYFDVQSRETRSPAIGYAGIGAAALGLSFVISYWINKSPRLQKAESLEVNPILSASAEGIQGINMVYHF